MSYSENAIKEEVVLTPIISKFGFSDYLVDTVNGRVWSKRSEKWLTETPNDNGYVYNSLIDDNGNRHAYGVHRLVMASAMGLPLEMFCRGKIEVDHIEEDSKHVNGIHNLQMSSRKGQYRESTRAKMGKGKRLSEEEVCEILVSLEEWIEDDDNKISDFIHMTAEAYGQGYRNIWNIVYGKSWKHLHKKYIYSDPSGVVWATDNKYWLKD